MFERGDILMDMLGFALRGGIIAASIFSAAPFGCPTADVSSAPSIVFSADGRSCACRSLVEALEISRRHGANANKTITLGAGKYFLETPLLLDERDDGLVIEGQPGTRPELLGGRAITGWKKGPDEFWVASVPGVKQGQWDFRSLLVNGRYAKRARWPAVGRLSHKTDFKAMRWLSTSEGGWERKPTWDELTKMAYQKGDLGQWFEPKNAELTIYHQWDETLVGVASIDLQSDTLVCATPAGHPIGSFDVRDYVVWNVEKGMTEPGQWYLDRVNGQVVYWPMPEEDMADVEVVAPVLENVLRLENAKIVTLRGLAIRSTNTPLIVGDFAAKMFDGAVSAKNSDHCVFEDLDVAGVTGWGLKLFGDHVTVKNCRIHDLGAGGLRVIGSHALIENNHIHDVGKTYPSAVMLYVGVTDPKMADEWKFGKDETSAVIRRNELHDGPYIGIAIGGSGHVVEYNKVYRVMQDLKDGAAFYATFCDHLKLRRNLVRDLKESHMIASYYLDEHSDSALIEENISINVFKPSQNHMSKDNLYRNNIFVSAGPMAITLPRCGKGFVFEKNVFVSGVSVTFSIESEIILKENVFDTPAVLVQQYKTGDYVAGDPVQFELPAGNRTDKAGLAIDGDDVAFQKGSAPEQMGIRRFKGSKAGLPQNILRGRQ